MELFEVSAKDDMGTRALEFLIDVSS
jgi:hypothetical protein